MTNNKETIVHTIEPRTGFINLDLKELWEYRELFAFLIWRDIKVKYKQTLLGILWVIIVPLIQMVIFTVIFGKLAKLNTDGLNPQIFYYAGLLPWNYFSTAVNSSTMSLVNSAPFLKKIYFPRLIIPTSPCIAPLLDFAIAFSIMIILMFYYSVVPDIAIIFIPVLILIAIGTSAGTGLLLSTLNLKYRDVSFIIPFLIQIWMYISVIFPFSQIPESFGDWRYLYGLNPMAGVIEGFRWCLMHNSMFTQKMIDGVQTNVPIDPPLVLIAMGFVVMLVIFSTGLIYFKRKEEFFADIV